MFEKMQTVYRFSARSALLALYVFTAGVTVGCATVRDKEPEASSVHDTLQQLATKYGICNVTAAVIKDRKIQSVDVAQGCAADSPLTADSVFEAASLSKPVFAYAVLKLVQEGKMDLDAPVLKYLPHGYEHRFRPYLLDSKTEVVSDPLLQEVTVRMALNHTSGLPNWAGGPLVFDHKPGEKWQYSGEGYVLLQRAVETVMNEKLDEFMERKVFMPLGMTHSGYTRKSRLEKYIVPGLDKEGGSMKPWPFLVPVSAFTLYTSARDYGIFLSALLNDERSLKQIVKVPVPVNSKLNLNWGLGWGLELYEDDFLIWHWGNNPGYRAFVIASPKTGDGFVLLANSDNGMTLAEPLSNKVMAVQHKVFRFHLLREGLANLLCETLDICL
jgi:CubicO group peptidase (beta-lactamase class C family)